MIGALTSKEGLKEDWGTNGVFFTIGKKKDWTHGNSTNIKKTLHSEAARHQNLHLEKENTTQTKKTYQFGSWAEDLHRVLLTQQSTTLYPQEKFAFLIMMYALKHKGYLLAGPDPLFIWWNGKALLTFFFALCGHFAPNGYEEGNLCGSQSMLKK